MANYNLSRINWCATIENTNRKFLHKNVTFNTEEVFAGFGRTFTHAKLNYMVISYQDINGIGNVLEIMSKIVSVDIFDRYNHYVMNQIFNHNYRPIEITANFTENIFDLLKNAGAINYTWITTFVIYDGANEANAIPLNGNAWVYPDMAMPFNSVLPPDPAVFCPINGYELPPDPAVFCPINGYELPNPTTNTKNKIQIFETMSIDDFRKVAAARLNTKPDMLRVSQRCINFQHSPGDDELILNFNKIDGLKACAYVKNLSGIVTEMGEPAIMCSSKSYDKDNPQEVAEVQVYQTDDNVFQTGNFFADNAFINGSASGQFLLYYAETVI